MIELLAVLTPIALVNSVAILPSGIIGVVASLGTQRPTLTAAAFIAGRFVPYFAFGLLLVLGLDAAFDRFNVWVEDTWRDRDAVLLALQLVIGGTMVVFGYRLSHAKRRRSIDAASMRMTPVRAFSVATGVTIVGLPGGLLYFAAIDQILRADPSVLGVVKALLYYNVVFLFPLILIVLVRQLFGTRTEPILAAMSGFLDRWGKRLLFFGLLGLGVVFLVDAIGWFLGFPLLPTYLP